MTKQEWRSFLEKGPIILDGATGTNLMSAGMPMGVCTESWALENKQVLIDLQRAYVEAGTNILYAPTFTGNRIKLKEYGLENQLVEMNRALVEISKEAAGEKAIVAGDITMTGKQLYPMGDLLFDDLVEVYKEQAKALADAGVDVMVVETMMSLQECRAAVLAIREICELPIMVSLSYENGRTLFGTPPEVATVVLQSLGIDAIGLNCSTGPMEMVELVKKVAEYATIPIFAKPNAGAPELENGKAVYHMSPEDFAKAGKLLVEAGAVMIGGCCGTTPEHIHALANAVWGMTLHTALKEERCVITSERKWIEVNDEIIIGKEIDVSKNQELANDLQDGELELVTELATDQEEDEVDALNIYVATDGLDEVTVMKQVIDEVSYAVSLPLCIQSDNADVVEAALRIYPGRAMVTTKSEDESVKKAILAIAKKYGAVMG